MAIECMYNTQLVFVMSNVQYIHDCYLVCPSLQWGVRPGSQPVAKFSNSPPPLPAAAALPG